MLTSPTTITKTIRYISIALFIIALTQPCMDTETSPGDTGEGIALLISGCFGFFSSATGLIWLANPALFISFICAIQKPSAAVVFNVIGLSIALLFLRCTEIMINEGGRTSPITGYRIGYWLWVASFLIMLAGNLYYKFSKPRLPDDGR